MSVFHDLGFSPHYRLRGHMCVNDLQYSAAYMFNTLKPKLV
jgi:hypothetical protein